MSKKDTKQEVNDLIANARKTWDSVTFQSFEEICILPPDKKRKLKTRNFVISKYNIYLLKTKKISIECVFHLLELEKIEKLSNGLILLTFRRGLLEPHNFDPKPQYLHIKPSTENESEILTTLRVNHRDITTGWPINRLTVVINGNAALDLPPSDNDIIAGGIVDSYKAIANLRDTPASEHLLLFIEDLVAKKCKDLDLSLCPGIDLKSGDSFDLMSLALALQYNSYFESFVLTDVNRKDAGECVSTIIYRNFHIKKLVVRQVGTTWPSSFGENLETNSEHKLSVIDISNNEIGTTAISSFIQGLCTCNHQIKVLNISKHNLNPRCIAAVIHGLISNFGMTLGIEELDLSHNVVDHTDISNLFVQWFKVMAPVSKLQRINFAGMQLDICALAGELKDLPELTFLELSKNKFNKAFADNLPKLASTCKKLEVLGLSDCGIPAEVLTKTMEALFSNANLVQLDLDISRNNVGSRAGTMLSEVIKRANNLRSLNIGHMGLKAKGGIPVMRNIQLCLHHLNLDGNFDRSQALETCNTLNTLLMSRPALSSLSLANGNLKEDIIPFFKAMETNDTLHDLNISGQLCGDSAFMILCKSLRKNKTLTKLTCHSNNLSHNSYLALKQALIHNETLQNVDIFSTTFDKCGPENPTFPAVTELNSELIMRKLNVSDKKKSEPLEHNNLDQKKLFNFIRDWPTPTSNDPPMNVPQDLLNFAKSCQQMLEKDNPNSASPRITSASPQKKTFAALPTEYKKKRRVSMTFAPSEMDTVLRQSDAPTPNHTPATERVKRSKKKHSHKEKSDTDGKLDKNSVAPPTTIPPPPPEAAPPRPPDHPPDSPPPKDKAPPPPPLPPKEK